MAEEELIGIEEAAAYVGLSVGTIYNRVSRGTIPYLKAGRLLRFRRSELEDWMSQHRVEHEEADESAHASEGKVA